MIIPRLAFIVGLVMALVSSQFPEFAQQYRQRLGGAIDEITRDVVQFKSEARMEHLSPEAAVERLQINKDILAQKRGSDMGETMARLTRLERQRDSFTDAGPMTRMLVLARDFDPAIASGAYASFEPAVPTTAEGFVTAIVGFFVGGGLLHLLAMPFRRRRDDADESPDVGYRPELVADRTQSLLLRERVNRFTLPRNNG